MTILLQDIQNVILTLSIVLHLGELEFHGVGNNEAAQVTNTDMLNTGMFFLISSTVIMYPVWDTVYNNYYSYIFSYHIWDTFTIICLLVWDFMQVSTPFWSYFDVWFT